MKAIITTFIALLATACCRGAMASPPADDQDLLSSVPKLVYSFGKDQRFGTALGDFDLEFWGLRGHLFVLTNNDWQDAFFGPAVSKTLYSNSYLSFSAHFGYTANFQEVTNPVDGQWSFGFTLGLKL